MEKVKMMEVKIDVLESDLSRCGIRCRYKNIYSSGHTANIFCGLFSVHLDSNTSTPKRCQECINTFGL